MQRTENPAQLPDDRDALLLGQHSAALEKLGYGLAVDVVLDDNQRVAVLNQLVDLRDTRDGMTAQTGQHIWMVIGQHFFDKQLLCFRVLHQRNPVRTVDFCDLPIKREGIFLFQSHGLS